MKSVAPLALLAFVTSVAAVDPNCGANYILEACRDTEKTKIENCDSQDYDCLCAGYQALRTCYNNCPNDPDISSTNSQVQIFCQNASLYGSKATATAPATASPTEANTTPAHSPSSTGTGADTGSKAAATGSSGDDEGSSAAVLARNTGAVLVTIAGAVAFLL